MKVKLNANQLKLVAILAMTLDHIAWMVFPGYSKEVLPLFLHFLGRVTCPIMCYFIAEGYYHTKNINRYTARLFCFAILSHIPYMLALSGHTDLKALLPFFGGSLLNQTSVMWSLAWGLVMLRVANSPKIKNGRKVFLILLFCVAAFPSDWSCIASLCILAFGTNRNQFRSQMLWMIFYVAIYAVVYFFALDKTYGILQMAVVAAIPFLALYNGERGRNATVNRWMKWAFYFYYPLHLLILGVIQAFF